MRFRPWFWVALISAPLILAGCSDSSDEVAELQAQVAELQAQAKSTTTQAPTTTQTQAPQSEDTWPTAPQWLSAGTPYAYEGFYAVDLKWGAAQARGGPPIEKYLLAVTYGFGEDLEGPRIFYTDGVQYEKTATGLVPGVTYELSVAAMGGDGQPGEVATTRLTIAAEHLFTFNEWMTLDGLCRSAPYGRQGSCKIMVSAATGGSAFRTNRACHYEDVKGWIEEKVYEDPEWRLFIEQECKL